MSRAAASSAARLLSDHGVGRASIAAVLVAERPRRQPEIVAALASWGTP